MVVGYPSSTLQLQSLSMSSHISGAGSVSLTHCVHPSMQRTRPSAQGPHSPVSHSRVPPSGSGPAQSLQPPHSQLFLQVRLWEPQSQQPRLSEAPGLQGPCPVHEDQSPHWQLDWQVLDFVPQLPQLCVPVWPGVQAQSEMLIRLAVLKLELRELVWYTMPGVWHPLAS
jgi:hypothetical protein